MIRYILRRLGYLAFTLIFTSIVIFLIAQVIPGDVCRVILGREAGGAVLESCRVDLGLNSPVGARYFNWLADFVSGDWGTSYSTNFDIRPLVMARVRNSLMLGFVVLLISVPISITLGVTAGLNAGKPIDNIISIVSLSVVGMPEFVTGIILINLFAFKWPIFPANSSIPLDASFFEALPSLILPAITAAFVLLAYITRLTRAGVIEEMKQDYVRTAELKGLSRRVVVYRHVLRNALLPTITVIAISIGWLVGGLIVIENVFNYPGLGRLLVFAIDRRDLPVLQAAVMITVVGFALANLAADLMYAVLNPRIRVGE